VSSESGCILVSTLVCSGGGIVEQVESESAVVDEGGTADRRTGLGAVEQVEPESAVGRWRRVDLAEVCRTR